MQLDATLVIAVLEERAQTDRMVAEILNGAKWQAAFVQATTPESEKEPEKE